MNDKGALSAFDLDTGETVWRNATDGPAYGSAVALELGGVRQIVVMSEKTLMGARPGGTDLEGCPRRQAPVRT